MYFCIVTSWYEGIYFIFNFTKKSVFVKRFKIQAKCLFFSYWDQYYLI